MLLWSDFIGKTNFAVRPQYGNLCLLAGSILIFSPKEAELQVRRLQKELSPKSVAFRRNRKKNQNKTKQKNKM